MAIGPGLRISDADREAAAAALREHYALGRLTLEEFQRRLDAVFAAKTDIELARITRDLPHASASPASAASARPFGYPAGNVSQPQLGPLGTAQSYSGQGRPRRASMAGTIMLLLALVLLVTLLWPLSLFGWFVPRPLLIVVAILVFARRMFRRLLGGGTMRPRGRRWRM